jgi:branched-chain amino acid transport system permease protein
VTLPQALTFFQEYENLLLGLVIMLSMIFLRRGIVPGLRGLWPARRAEPAPA